MAEYKVCITGTVEVDGIEPLRGDLEYRGEIMSNNEERILLAIENNISKIIENGDVDYERK